MASKTKLHEVAPRESAGRDTILRYTYQFRAAGHACLQILEDSEIDFVYCDYHDDYVVRKNINGVQTYQFHQVKTKNKKSYQWSRRDVFGVKKRGKSEEGSAVDSFAGKLYFHILYFKNACESLHLVTNIHFEEELDNFLSDVAVNDKHTDLCSTSKIILDKILETFKLDFKDIDDTVSDEKLFLFLKKLNLDSDAICLRDDSGALESSYLSKIYEYSEINLTYRQAQAIASSLLEVVKNKSLSKIKSDVTEAELNAAAGICLTDLLDVLSISKEGYGVLKSGGDISALKNVSLIQRILKNSGASDELIQIACSAKVKWDNWLMEYRHIIQDVDLLYITDSIAHLLKAHVQDGRSFKDITIDIEELYRDVSGNFHGDLQLTKDHLLGLFFSLAVKESLS